MLCIIVLLLDIATTQGGVEIRMVLPNKTTADCLDYSEELEDSLEENVYSKKIRAKLVEDGEISNEEEGFMEGYDFEEELDEK